MTRTAVPSDLIHARASQTAAVVQRVKPGKKNDPPDVLVHCGFHKTGTTSIQSCLALNRSALEAHFLYYAKADFPKASKCARSYSRLPTRTRLRRFRLAWRKFLADLPADRRIVITREAFSGNPPAGEPWLGGQLSYWFTAPRIARVIVGELARRFGSERKLALLYTTRGQEAWLASLYGHLLRTTRLTRGPDRFAGKVKVRDLSEEVHRVARAVPGATVLTAALEDYSTARLRPAELILDAMGVEQSVRDALRSAGRQNSGDSPELRQRFLEMNRRTWGHRNLKATKRKMARSVEYDEQ